MKKHVKEEHEKEERLKEQEESPPRKESKKEDLNVRFDVPDKEDDGMEESPIEEKEAKEARIQEEILSMRKWIYDQNQILFNLKQEKDKLAEEQKLLEIKLTLHWG